MHKKCCLNETSVEWLDSGRGLGGFQCKPVWILSAVVNFHIKTHIKHFVVGPNLDGFRGVYKIHKRLWALFVNREGSLP